MGGEKKDPHVSDVLLYPNEELNINKMANLNGDKPSPSIFKYTSKRFSSLFFSCLYYITLWNFGKVS